MTTHSRIAAFLSTSALCLGLAAAPAAFAADATAKPGETKSQMEHTGKHHKADKTSAAGSRQARRRQVRQDGQDRQGRRDDAGDHAGQVSRRGPHPQFLCKRDSDAAPSPPGNSKASRYGRREAFHSGVPAQPLRINFACKNQVPQAGPRGAGFAGPQRRP